MSCYSFGRNTHGELGDGTLGGDSHAAGNRMVAGGKQTGVQVPEGQGKGWVRAGCSKFSSYAITDEGRLFSWGCSYAGQTGHGNNEGSTAIPQVPGSLVRQTQITQVSGGRTHAMVLTETGVVFSWGRDQFGQVGHGDKCDQLEPRPLRSLSSQFRVVQIACGSSHSLAVAEDGSVLAWGRASRGQLGYGDTLPRASPTLIQKAFFKNSRVKAVWAGHSSSGAATEDGACFTWGDGSAFQLGTGDTKASAIPRQVETLSREVIVAGAAGCRHMLALTDCGMVFGWGSCRFGAHGGGASAIGKPAVEVRSPAMIASLMEHNIIEVAAGHSHSMARTDAGVVLGWGCNLYGQLGVSRASVSRSQGSSDGHDPGVCIDEAVELAISRDADKKAVSIACGDWHTLVVTAHSE